VRTAKSTPATSSPQPGNPYAVSGRHLADVLAERGNLSDRLMAWYHVSKSLGQIAFDYVQISAADATRLHTDQNFVRSRSWCRHFRNL